MKHEDKPTPRRRPNRTTLEIPPQLREPLRALSARTGRAQSQLILQAIEKLLKEEGLL